MEVKKLKQVLAAVVINISEEDGSVQAAVRMTVEDELLSETPQVFRVVNDLDDVPLQEMFEELMDKFNQQAVEDQSKKKKRKRKPKVDTAVSSSADNEEDADADNEDVVEVVESDGDATAVTVDDMF